MDPSHPTIWQPRAEKYGWRYMSEFAEGHLDGCRFQTFEQARREWEEAGHDVSDLPPDPPSDAGFPFCLPDCPHQVAFIKWAREKAAEIILPRLDDERVGTTGVVATPTERTGMETEEQRDETHVEQHGDGDVNIEPPAQPEPQEQPAEGGDSEESSSDE